MVNDCLVDNCNSFEEDILLSREPETVKWVMYCSFNYYTTSKYLGKQYQVENLA